MRKAAKLTAILGFFGLALVGWLSGAGPYDCAVRGLLGAAVLYMLIRFGEYVLNKVADAPGQAVTDDPPATVETTEDKSGEQ